MYQTKEYRISQVFCSVCKGIILLLFSIVNYTLAAQSLVVDKKSFFTDERLIKMTIVTDIRKLIGDKLKKNYAQNFQPATVTFLFPDSTEATAEVEIRARGDFRREECYMPPLMINFKTSNAAALRKLGRLKLVLPCDNNVYNEQLVLKEYLVYKIYNQLTDKSFRVRLVRINYRDIKERIKPYASYAFFIEDVDDMAKRNNCIEIDTIKFHTEQTNREQTTLFSLFQYMIGNTDWAVSVYHNIKMIRSREDSVSRPFMVPYDFDGCGLVNADYAIPSPDLEIVNVRQRLYRGFSREMGELQYALQALYRQRKVIDSLIMSLRPLSVYHKKEMINYLDEFYTATAEEDEVNRLFIYKARRE